MAYQNVPSKGEDKNFKCQWEGPATRVSTELHLFCLHYVYLPHINRALTEFTEQWNHHPVSTVSPYQLWVSGMLASANSFGTAVCDVMDGTEEPLQYYGVDENGPLFLLMMMITLSKFPL